MKIWSNTKTLDGLVDDLEHTKNPEEAEIALIGGKPIDLNLFPNLKGIFKTGVGTDNIPYEIAAERGIEIRLPSDETKGYIYEETANFTCFSILRILYLNLGELENWTKHSRVALSKKVLLIVGTGRVGGMVADKMKSFVDVSDHEYSKIEGEKTPEFQVS